MSHQPHAIDQTPGIASPFSDEPVERSPKFLRELSRLVAESGQQAKQEIHDQSLADVLARQAAETGRHAIEHRSRVAIGTYRYRLGSAAGEVPEANQSLSAVADLKRETNTRMVIAAVNGGLGDATMTPQDAASRIIIRLVEQTGRTRREVCEMTVDDAIAALVDDTAGRSTDDSGAGRPKTYDLDAKRSELIDICLFDPSRLRDSRSKTRPGWANAEFADALGVSTTWFAENLAAFVREQRANVRLADDQRGR